MSHDEPLENNLNIQENLLFLQIELFDQIVPIHFSQRIMDHYAYEFVVYFVKYTPRLIPHRIIVIVLQ